MENSYSDIRDKRRRDRDLNINRYVYYSKLYDQIILPTILVVLSIFMIGVLIGFIYYRQKPQFQYRSVLLTFLYGFSNASYIILTLVARLYDFSCITRLWITDIFIVTSLFSLMGKGIRILYLWKFNCYKLSKSKMRNVTLYSNQSESEVNVYFKAVYKFINKKAKRIIIIPVIIDFMITGYVSYKLRDKCRNSSLSFLPLFVFLSIFTITFPYFIYKLHKVHENHRITTEFEYVITTVVWIIFLTFYIVLTYFPQFKGNDVLQYYTSNGIFFFVIHEFICFVIIMSIPFIEMFNDRAIFKNFEGEMTIENFYKLINDPIIIEELKNIALSEFSIENVLFWESYCELMKLTKVKKPNTFKKIINGISNVPKNIKGKSSFNKLMINDQVIDGNNNFNIYENRKYDSKKYYENIYRSNNRSRSNSNEMKNGSSIYYNDKNNNPAMNTNNLINNNDYAYNSINTNYQLQDCNGLNVYNYNTLSTLSTHSNSDNNYMDNYNHYRPSKQYFLNIEDKSKLDIKSNDSSSIGSSEITADSPVPLKYLNYYRNFYHLFIDLNSSAAVNINCSVREAIEENINNPKVGIFDEAKDEIISLMFRNLCPKLILRLKQKEII